MEQPRRRPARPPDPPAARAGALRYHEDFPSRFLGNRRPLAVALPASYDADPSCRHPVVYLHDGQNVFDLATAPSGVTWDAHRTAERLAGRGRIPPLILVGIGNTPDRIDEYTTCPDPGEGAGGKGRLYARFVLDEVKPFIDARYRTLPGRGHTAVAGSSLGGLVSLTMAREHRDRFARCAALSPSLWWAGGRVQEDLARDTGWMRGMRIWLDMGTREGYGGVGRARRLARVFAGAGMVRGRDFRYREVRGGEHNEAAWAARFDQVLLFLFGGR